MTEFHPREIGLNWHGEGPEGEGYSHCRGCEHRDGDLCSSPVYGYWTGESPQAEVMLLGEAPGGNSGNGRQTVDSSDQYNCEYVENNQKERDWFENEERNLKHKLRDSDIQIPVTFIEKIRKNHNYDVYFTNVKKCNDVDEGQGEEYDKAREKCRNYLFDEIEQVKPELIVVFSSSVDGLMPDGIKKNTNLHQAFYYFGIKDIPTNVTDVVFPNKDNSDSLFPAYDTEYSFKIIPCTHFTRIAGTLNSPEEYDLPYDEIGDETDGRQESVYTELANSIREVL